MRLLAVAAASEATLAIALLVDPPLVFRLLLASDASGAALAMGRVAGVALLSLSVACWPERSASARGPALRAMLTYNTLATLYLASLGLGGEWVGPLLWPAVVLHAGFTVAFGVALRPEMRPEAVR